MKRKQLHRTTDTQTERPLESRDSHQQSCDLSITDPTSFMDGFLRMPLGTNADRDARIESAWRSGSDNRPSR